MLFSHDDPCGDGGCLLCAVLQRVSCSVRTYSICRLFHVDMLIYTTSDTLKLYLAPSLWLRYTDRDDEQREKNEQQAFYKCLTIARSKHKAPLHCDVTVRQTFNSEEPPKSRPSGYEIKLPSFPLLLVSGGMAVKFQVVKLSIWCACLTPSQPDTYITSERTLPSARPPCGRWRQVLPRTGSTFAVVEIKRRVRATTHKRLTKLGRCLAVRRTHLASHNLMLGVPLRLLLCGKSYEYKSRLTYA